MEGGGGGTEGGSGDLLIILLGGADLGIGGGVLGACNVALRGFTLHMSGESGHVPDLSVAD